MYKGIFHTHYLSVTLFFLIYLIKTILLISNKEETLAKFTKAVKIPEMIISFLFLLTGVYMLTQIPVISTLLIIKLVAVVASIPLAVIGFKKKNKALAVVSFILICAAFALAEISKKHPEKAAATVEDMNDTTPKIVDGKTVFETNCISCHGADGQAGVAGAANLTASGLDLNSKVEIIRNGKGSMQAFGGALTEEEIQAVAAYIETLKK
jgi:mono/diheme cytochrome c family protein